jgi:hypothetical protein
MSRASERKLRRRQAHGPQQTARKTEALAESRLTAKKQRKGAKGVETAMRRHGYLGGLVVRRVRYAGGRLETVRVHVWRRQPQEETA